MLDELVEIPSKRNYRKTSAFKKYFLIFFVFISLSFIVYLIWHANIGVDKIVIENDNKNISKDIYVDISGAVNIPGIYKMKAGDRIYQVIEKAKGINDQANKEWVQKKLNLAKEITDQQKIYIPFEGEQSESLDIDKKPSNNGVNSEKLNLNTIDKKQLILSTQLSENLITKIISARERLAGFKNWAEVDAVDGVGEKSLEKLHNCCYIQH